MARLLSRLGAAFAALMFAGAVFAQTPPLTAPVYKNAAGFPLSSIGMICLNLDGTSCTFGGGGGALTVNASALPTAITAGSGKSLNVGLFSNLFATLVDASGAPVDFTATSPVQCGSNASPVTCALASGQWTLDADGAGIYPKAANANRVLTATNLSANTSTTICPTATNPVVTEVYFTTAGVGVGVSGQTLTTATPGTSTTGSPDFAIGTAGILYTFPVAPTGIVTAYGAAGVVRCIQTLRR